MILLKECLKEGITPFVILDRDKQFYYRGLREYPRQKGYLIGTCQMSQDIYEEWLQRFMPPEKEVPFQSVPSDHDDPQR